MNNYQRLSLGAHIERLLAEDGNSEKIPSLSNNILKYLHVIPSLSDWVVEGSIKLPTFLSKKDDLLHSAYAGANIESNNEVYRYSFSKNKKGRSGQYKIWVLNKEVQFQHYWASDINTQTKITGGPPVFFIGFNKTKSGNIYSYHGYLMMVKYRIPFLGITFPFLFREKVVHLGGKKRLFDSYRSIVFSVNRK